MSAKIPVITLDGPAGVGKSTISCLLAQRFSYGILISGALYRSVALFSLRRQIPVDHLSALLDIIAELVITFVIADDKLKTILNDEDVTSALQSEECAERASLLGQIGKLRQALLVLQRSFRTPPGLVADGRDMGTVVFSDAANKFFLTATLEERAKRRFKQLQGKNFNDKLPALCKHLAKRDQRDQTRGVAPLIPAADAVVIDTTGKDIASVMNEIVIYLSE